MSDRSHEQGLTRFEGGHPPSGGSALGKPLWSEEAGPGHEGGLKTSLRELKKILRRRKWTILLVSLLVTGLVGTYTFLSSPTYEAYTILMVEEPPPPQSDDQNLLRSGRVGALNETRHNMTDQSLLLRQSLPIAKATVRRLRQSRSRIDGPIAALNTEGQEDTTRTALAERLQEKHVSVQREDSREGHALRVTASSTNPQEAAFIANAYAEEYIDHVRQSNSRRITSARSFLKRQRERYEKKLRNLEDKMQEYKSRDGAAALEEEMRQRIEQRSELEAQLAEARVEQERAQAALNSVQSELEEIRPQLAKRVSSGVDEEIRQAQSRIAELEGRLEQIYVKNPELRDNASQNEDVIELKNEIEKLRKHVGQLTNRYVGEMMAVGGTEPFKTGGGTSTTYVTQLKRQAAEERVALSGAEARISALQRRLAESEQRLQNIPKQSTQLARLQRRLATAEKVYTTLTDQLQEVRLADKATIAPAEVVRSALVPEDPVLPRALVLVAGVLLGLSLGVIAAVVRHKTDSRLYTPEDLRDHNFRPAGVVPDWRLVDNRRLVASVDDREARRDGRLSETTAIATRQKASVAAAEAYRRLYVNVQTSSSRDAPVQTVLVTSPEPGVGKSTTVLNLAVAAARSGRRTFLVDADLRKPQIREILDIAEGPFLTDLLNNPDATVKDAEDFATPVDNLSVAVPRKRLEDPDVVLSSQKMERVIERLRARFDLIVFDTPPVLAVADATFLASRCDATIVVAQAGRTEAEELRQATEELREAHAEVAGIVLNRFNPSEPSSYASRYQYQDYVYDSDQGAST